jgi:hypothetical protein
MHPLLEPLSLSPSRNWLLPLFYSKRKNIDGYVIEYLEQTNRLHQRPTRPVRSERKNQRLPLQEDRLDHERLDFYVATLDFVTVANRLADRLPRSRLGLTDQLLRGASF